ncbi:hypothetical protein AB5G67_004494, partial [Vibrio vulnificus]
MLTIEKVVVDIPELKEYADYGSIRQELNVIIKYFDSSELIDDDGYLFDAIATAALVKYARIFKSGVRFKVSASEVGFSPDELEAHNYMISLRDKHVSHSVNHYERAQVVAHLEFEDRSKNVRVSSISTEPSRVLMTKSNLWCIYELSKKVRDYIDRELINKYPESYNLVAGMTQDELKALRKPQPLQINHLKVANARKVKK